MLYKLQWGLQGVCFLNEIIFLTTNCFMAMDCQIEAVNGIQLEQRNFKGISNKAQTPPEKCQFGLSIYVT